MNNTGGVEEMALLSTGLSLNSPVSIDLVIRVKSW